MSSVDFNHDQVDDDDSSRLIMEIVSVLEDALELVDETDVVVTTSSSDVSTTDNNLQNAPSLDQQTTSSSDVSTTDNNLQNAPSLDQQTTSSSDVSTTDNNLQNAPSLDQQGEVCDVDDDGTFCSSSE